MSWLSSLPGWEAVRRTMRGTRKRLGFAKMARVVNEFLVNVDGDKESGGWRPPTRLDRGLERGGKCEKRLGFAKMDGDVND